MSRTTKSAVISMLLAGALATTGLGAPAHAATPHARPSHGLLRQHHSGVASPPTTSASVIDVVVPLHVSAATHAAVAQLAHARVSGVARRARLRALAPAATHAGAVESWARAHGFAVTTTTPWSVGLRGRADALAAAFGTHLGTRTFRGKSFVTPRTAGRVPSALAGLADQVIGLDTRPLFHTRDVYGGGDLQVQTSVPVRGKTAGSGATVATVNLSGWHPNDLTIYRHAAFGSADVAPTVTPIVVPGTGGHVNATVLEDDFGLEPEVALDAEAIAGVAPSAQQRMYFGGNSAAAYVLILQQMVTDLTDANASNDFQTASTSWGACELGMDDSTLSAMDNAITAITAAGATFFAASGDDGGYGCGDGQTPSVDFPASAGNAVAVGGTTVSGQAPTYSGTAWSGSGGGCSTRVAAPARQLSTGTACSMRSVPDIANLADPQSGLWVYDAFDEWVPIGGTSLASPASAAGLADAMAHAGKTTLAPGSFLDLAYAHPAAFTDVTVGDNGLFRTRPGYDLVTGLGTPKWTELEAAITGGAVPTITGFNEPLLALNPTNDPSQAFIDNVLPDNSVLNGFSANGEPMSGVAVSGTLTTSCASTAPAPPSAVSLPFGADRVAQLSVSVATTDPDPGITGGCITVQRPVVLDSHSPTVPVPVVTYTGTTSPSYRFSWGTAADAAPSSGILAYVVIVHDITTNTDRAAYVTTGRAFPYAGSSPLALTIGHAYSVQVLAFDDAFNHGQNQVSWFTPYDDRSASISSGWTRVSNKLDFAGSHLQSALAGKYYSVRFHGKTLTAGMIKGTYGGYADVYVDNVKKFRMSLYRSSTAYRQSVRLATFSTVGSHTVVVKVVGAHQTGSKGNYVYLDSLTVT